MIKSFEKLFFLSRACVLLLSFHSPIHGISLGSTKAFTTASGLIVSQYGLGGAARTSQPSSLASLYFNEVTKQMGQAPFYFYYNPHRYAPFMSGIKKVCSKKNREDIFVASGGTGRSSDALDQRLSDCLKYCGEKYLDIFFIEYVVPEEMEDSGKPGVELATALKHVQKWVESGSVRYVGISTHSHVVGAKLSYCADVDVLMLRYGMSHKDAAEKLSLPPAKENGKPVIAFTSTRWNSLQVGTDNDQWPLGDAPTSADCLSFVFGSKTSPPINSVLHSARDEDELIESMAGLRTLSEAEETKWRSYGEIFENSNDDFFDEYPEERGYHISDIL